MVLQRKNISVVYKYEGWARGGLMSYTSPRETSAVTSSQPNSEVLIACVVLAHSHAAFHPYMYGLCRCVLRLLLC
jgi:hypothetical protein